MQYNRHGRWFVRVDVRFEPRDLWVGVYWKRYTRSIEVFVCLIPMVPVVIYLQRRSC